MNWTQVYTPSEADRHGGEDRHRSSNEGSILRYVFLHSGGEVSTVRAANNDETQIGE
jgi:hypothetical protein